MIFLFPILPAKILYFVDISPPDKQKTCSSGYFFPTLYNIFAKICIFTPATGQKKGGETRKPAAARFAKREERSKKRKGKHSESFSSLLSLAENHSELSESTKMFIGKVSELSESIKMFIGKVSEPSESTKMFVGKVSEPSESIKMFIGKVSEPSESTKMFVGKVSEPSESIKMFVGKVSEPSERIF